MNTCATGKDSQNRFRQLRARFERALGPVAAGVILDLVDLATFGPVGIFLGPLLGGLVGWYLSGVLCIPQRWRFSVAALAGFYCMLPRTEFIPVATIVGALARFFEAGPKQPPPSGSGSATEEKGL